MFLFRYEVQLDNTRGKPEMGYAIFTARKLMLTNRINQLNFRIMQLTQQQQTLADQAARSEMANANLRNLFSGIGNMITMSLGIQGQNAQSQLLQGAQAGAYDASSAQGLYSALAPYQMQQQAVTSIFASMQQMIQTQSDTQMRNIKEMENNIELQRKSLETQVKAASAELKSVEEQEDKQIQNSAPKFA